MTPDVPLLISLVLIVLVFLSVAVYVTRRVSSDLPKKGHIDRA